MDHVYIVHSKIEETGDYDLEGLFIRRLRIVKYRGSSHGPDEYPFLIDDSGISILPISSLGLDHPVSTERCLCFAFEESLRQIIRNMGIVRPK